MESVFGAVLAGIFLELLAGIAAGSPECSCKAAMRYIVLLNPSPTGSGG